MRVGAPERRYQRAAGDLVNSVDRWAKLAVDAERLSRLKIETLLQPAAARSGQWRLRLGPLLVDLSKQRLDDLALRHLLDLADASGLAGAIRDLFAGVAVNRSEQRPALHTALRAPIPAPTEDSVPAQAARAAHEVLGRLGELVEQLRSESRESGITDIVHIGIGGSDLGPRLVYEALAHLQDGRFRVHFVANVDGGAAARLVATLDPRRTLVCLVSKSFSTQETLLNGRVLRNWLAAGVGEAQVGRHFLAISSNVPAAVAFGIDAARVLPMWDWVGGRYSLWSAVGFPVAAALGMDVFRRLLDGAHAMDVHYANAPLAQNIPVLMALVGVWNRSVLQLPTLAVIPYDDRLRLLPGFLQQLDMESNGKRVDQTGAPIARAGAPVIWGEVGTNAQHAFFQSLHQGIDTVPVDFIGVIQPAHPLRDNHQALLANLLAQSAAMMRGTEDSDESVLSRQKHCPGGRPNSVILLDELGPEALGMLLAAYEHKVHAQGVIWGVNSFDQWGVELGKLIARSVLPVLQGVDSGAALDTATRALIAEIRSRWR